MKKKRSNGGFTLAELLIVVAIIGVLSGVAFVAVQSHERSLTQLELDTVAKEIFVAAQNHLTVAKTLGYNGSGRDKYGNPESTENPLGVYYFNTKEHSFTEAGDTLLDQMLPFGSIDETVRTGGKYIIRYQPGPGVVLDVFYWEDKSASPAYGDLMADTTLRVVENREYRANYSPMIGWFGGVKEVQPGEYLETPSIEVINGEKLVVKVTDTNLEDSNKNLLNPMLKLIIEGKESGARLAFTLTKVTTEGSTYAIPSPTSRADSPKTRLQNVTSKTGESTVFSIVLDDITTQNMRFAQLNELNPVFENPPKFPKADELMEHTWDTASLKPGTNLPRTSQSFIPGEDIIIQAVAYSNTRRASVAYSGQWTVNSLFGGVREEKDGDKVNKVALISNIRHLENLDEKVSALNNNSKAVFDSAEQTVNLDWGATEGTAGFRAKIGNPNVSIYSYGEDEDGNDVVYTTKPGCYLPVSPSYALIYNGQSAVKNGDATVKANHSVSNIAVDDSDYFPEGIKAAQISAGGMFGTLSASSNVSNLELKDFSINVSSGDAGALAGTITDTTISNVVAYNSSGITTDDKRAITASGSAGGLIGSMTKDSATSTVCRVEKSAAALIVSSTSGNAGGLIGTTSSGTVTACYSGGHTINKSDKDGNVIGVEYDKTNYNVTASGIAGGLIGTAVLTTIDHSYSTCSVTGKTAGGFVGTASGGISSCYATGLVCGTEKDTVKVDNVDTSIPKDGAFAYTSTGTMSDCKYFEIINEREDETKGFDYLTALGQGKTSETITAFDASAATYDDFVGVPEADANKTNSGWKNAKFYDIMLKNYYGAGDKEDEARYNLRTVAQLGATGVQTTEQTVSGVTTAADFVATHYGDWPAPEIFVINTAS